MARWGSWTPHEKKRVFSTFHVVGMYICTNVITKFLYNTRVGQHAWLLILIVPINSVQPK